MAFVKIQKNKAYCSRYQTKYRRRREGKTDYQARRRLVFQDKNKYDSKKYRFVVRRTCTKIICQVIFATLSGDRVMTSASSQELRAHGLTAGLTNYAAAYATGLLCARRLLNLKKMDTMYEGVAKCDGKLYSVADHATDRQPFKAHLDIGLVRATTGNRAFSAMKGAADGGLFVPHTEKRFCGFKCVKEAVVTNKRGKAQEAEKAKSSFSPEELKSHILGGHVQIYYDLLKKGDAAPFKKQFSQWEKCLVAAKVKTMEELYVKVHAAIRAKPAFTKKAASKNVRKVVQAAPEAIFQDSKGRKWRRQAKTASSVKRERIAKLMAQIKATISK
jgi:large subunit ribosomal protein L5e